MLLISKVKVEAPSDTEAYEAMVALTKRDVETIGIALESLLPHTPAKLPFYSEVLGLLDKVRVIKIRTPKGK